jgi:hypothetical protein
MTTFEVGQAIAIDPTCRGMMRGGRPITNVEMQGFRTYCETLRSEGEVMDVSGFLENRWLTAMDLHGHERASVTIDYVEEEQVGPPGRKTPKPVVYFVGKQKGLALNKTNLRCLVAHFGTDTDLWIGKSLDLVVRIVDGIGSGKVPAIRIDVKGGLPHAQK